MNQDIREIRKERVLTDMRNEKREAQRIKNTPEGRRAFLLKWMDDNFLRRRIKKID
jgi:hypothetical protein